jgi:hypothetical protein
MLNRLYVAAAVRLRDLTSPEHRDLGEGPVPYIIMVAIMAAGALLVGGLIVGVAQGWLTHIPKNP